MKKTLRDDEKNQKGITYTNGFYDEVYRPQFHFSPESMWLNDPNGLVYYNGEYHLFYQHYPDGTTHGPMYWGHAVSKDLVYWEHLPIALYPDPMGFIFSGSAIVDERNVSGLQAGDEKVIVAFFTHASDECQSQSMAFSNDKGKTWTKYGGNPVVPNPGIKDFRDPFVFWNESYERYNMVVTMGDRLSIYSSMDLKAWKFESEFGKEEGSHGGVWECPALIELDIDGKENEKKWLLLVSVFSGAPAGGSGTQYFIGQFDGKTFINENSKDTVLWVDYGKDNYAGIPWNGIPKEDGRAICIGWMNNWIYANKIPTSTWRGALTIPRELKLSEINGETRLLQNPVNELTILRQRKHTWLNQCIDSQGPNILADMKGDTFEFIAEFDLGHSRADSFGFRLRKGENDVVEIGYDKRNLNVYIDRTCCGDTAFDENYPGIHKAPMKSNSDTLKMHIFLDRSSVELFVNNGEVTISDQIFPNRNSFGMELFSANGSVTLRQLEIYELKKIWDESKNDRNNSKMIAYWPFDEGQGNEAEDRVTKIKDKINYIFNEARYKPSSDPIWKDGINGKALLFDGYSTWISRAAKKIQKPGESLTIEAWITPRSFGQGDEGELSAIVSQCCKGSKEGYILGVTRYGRWSFQVGTRDKWIELWSNEKYLEVNVWSHIAGVFDGNTGKMAIYLNGQELVAIETAKGSRIAPCDTDFLIGRNNEDEKLNDAFIITMFHGIMDEVKIYKSAISPEDIKKSYNQNVDKFRNGTMPAVDSKQLRSEYKGDRHRPDYHFIAPEHWMNEPHGPLLFNGQYHIFYQHNPKGPYFGNIHWGHAVSVDMVHWKDQPFALAPQKGQVDPDGCWSGSSVIDDSGIPTLFFTAGDFSKNPNQRIAVAKSTFDKDKDNDLKKWVKNTYPSVVQEKGQGYFGEFRDPFVWKEDSTWYMLVGSGIPEKGGTALLYTSLDLVDWKYQKPIFAGNMEKYPKTGKVWELPVLFYLGTDKSGTRKHILLINPCFIEESPYTSRFIFYWIGTWDVNRMEFIPDDEQPQMFDYGEHFTGPSGMVDDKERNILFSIAQDRRTEKQHHDSGWAHNAGLPVILSLREDGRLGVDPIPELQSLRREKLVSLENKTLDEANYLLKDSKGDMLEILLEIEAKGAENYGIKLRCTPDGTEETAICFNQNSSYLSADRTKSSLDPDAEKDVKGGSLDIDGDNTKLHIYIDRSMIEVYANGLKSLTTRAYPTRDDADGLKIWSDGDITVKFMEVWQLGSIYE